MKINVYTKELKNVIEKIIKVAPKKSSVPMLEEVCFAIIDEKTLIIKATDLEVFINGKLEFAALSAIQTGKSFILQDTKTFIKSLKFFKEDFTELDFQENIVIIKNGNKSSKIKLIDEEFPNVPLIQEALEYHEYDMKKFKERIKKIGYATSKESNRPILQGIHFNECDIVALDGFRVAVNTDNALKISTPFTIHKEHLNYSANTLKDKFAITLNDKLIVFKDETFEITIRKLSGDYPDYRKFIAAESKNNIKINKEEVDEGVKYLLTFNKEKKNIVKFENKSMSVGEQAKIDLNIDNLDMTIGFNGNYMIDALSQFTSETLLMRIDKPVAPIIIESENDLALVLPIRL